MLILSLLGGWESGTLYTIWLLRTLIEERSDPHGLTREREITRPKQGHSQNINTMCSLRAKTLQLNFGSIRRWPFGCIHGQGPTSQFGAPNISKYQHTYKSIFESAAWRKGGEDQSLNQMILNLLGRWESGPRFGYSKLS